MLGLLNPGREGFFRVVLLYGNDRLHDDRAGVRAAVDKLDRAAGVANPVVKSLLLGMETLEGWEQGRVDVHYCIWKGVDHNIRQNSHETGQNYQVDLVAAQYFNCGGIVRASIGKTGVFMDDNRYPVPCRPGKGIGIRSVADDTGDLGTDLSRFYPVDDCLKVGAASRDQDTQTAGCVR